MILLTFALVSFFWKLVVEKFSQIKAEPSWFGKGLGLIFKTSMWWSSLCLKFVHIEIFGIAFTYESKTVKPSGEVTAKIPAFTVMYKFPFLPEVFPPFF